MRVNERIRIILYNILRKYLWLLLHWSRMLQFRLSERLIRMLEPLALTIARHWTNFKVKVKMPRDSFIKMIKNAPM